MFEPAPAFAHGSLAMAELPLCQVRLQLDARWPWLILIPRRAGLVEIEDLASAERAWMIEEAVVAGAAVRAMGVALGRPVEKLNLGQLGNLTPQLHVHLVGRRSDDDAWPGPVWSHGAAVPYAPAALGRVCAAALSVLQAP